MLVGHHALVKYFGSHHDGMNSKGGHRTPPGLALIFFSIRVIDRVFLYFTIGNPRLIVKPVTKTFGLSAFTEKKP
jgi:hypothetical protein